MQTVETRLRSEMDAIFNFLGVTRSSVHLPNTTPSCPANHRERHERKMEETNNNDIDDCSLYHHHRLPPGDKLEENDELELEATAKTSASPPRPQTLDMTDPRQRLLKSQQLIEKHINKLLKELDEKNVKNGSPSSRLHSSS